MDSVGINRRAFRRGDFFLLPFSGVMYNQVC